MSNLSNEAPISETESPEKRQTSSGVMLVTLLLLIAALLLTSTMMVHYAIQQQDGNGQSIGAQLAGMLDKGKAYSSQFKGAVQQKSQQEEAKTQTAASKAVSLFSSSAGKKVKWPRMALAGFGRSTDGDGGFAIINGDQILPGQYAGKVKLVEIRNQGVVVEYMGEQKYLTVDLQQD
ncbi:hypothetical protein [Pontiella sulfatireligans]|uniref:Uncharacterized protein n=1 Tax=Pontiella sulfatireligans TaxID=2750658 RepID=A0A6C2UKY3_9BACT|nr:hypothetical protein [Pontiella sulfatireligans]VGO20077.1 hypothetical protein SCARR_02137 [Pontiella sulfatireligans]